MQSTAYQGYKRSTIPYFYSVIEITFLPFVSFSSHALCSTLFTNIFINLHTMSSFTKFLDQLKTSGDRSFTNTSLDAAVPNQFDNTVFSGGGINQGGPHKRRWSYVTYLNEGTLHAEGDNLMLGL